MKEMINKIYALCQCDHYDFIALQDDLLVSCNAERIRNVVQLQWHGGEVFIFDYGVVVFWKVPDDQRDELLLNLHSFAQQLLENTLDDEFTFEINATQPALKNDHVELPDNEISTRLAISHGIAQSTKLMQYETRVSNTITSSEYIPNRIATTGKSGLRRNALSKLRGQLYLTKSDVMLHYDLLDVPEFFWEYPELQPYYTMISDYLEIKPRIEVLSKKLETIQDLLEMIADEQKHSHSSLLEWIIIWLIAIDIVIILLQEFIL